jgi:hypothetical protein
VLQSQATSRSNLRFVAGGNSTARPVATSCGTPGAS